MRRFMQIVESYSKQTGKVRDHLKSSDVEFNYRRYWELVCEWAVEEGKLDSFRERLKRPGLTLAELKQMPEAFLSLTPEDQSECARWVYDVLWENDRRELPSHFFLSLRQENLIPRNTWLIHFSENARQISRDGFRFGMSDVTRLGQTTHYRNTDPEKKDGGYNFAFLADPQHAELALKRGWYGANTGAVMFQSSGVLTHHDLDDEDQVIFHGADVDPRDIVWLNRSGDEWQVMAAQPGHGHGGVLFVGGFDRAVTWVKEHFVRYRHVLTRR